MFIITQQLKQNEIITIIMLLLCLVSQHDTSAFNKLTPIICSYSYRVKKIDFFLEIG
jgi:hypothetical protein